MHRRLALRSDSCVPCLAHGILAALLIAATAGSAGADVAIGLNFTGRRPDAPLLFPIWPHRPDTMGAVGEQHIVELLNNGYAVYRKSDGAVLQRTSTLNEFWEAAGVTPLGTALDPRVVYDAANRRWFASSIDGLFPYPDAGSMDPNSYLVAVSKSADPTEGWTGFQIDSDPTDTSWADHPRLGMDADGLYLTTYRFGFAATIDLSPRLGNNLLVLPKADLLAATPSIANATNWSTLTVGQLGFIPQLVVNYDGTGLPATLLDGTLAYLGILQSTKIGGSIASPVLAQSKFIRVPATKGPAGTFYLAAQPGPKADLQALDERFAVMVQVGGSIWAAQTTQVDGRLAVRWYEIDAATDSLLQYGEVTDPILDLFYPSIAVNEFGQVVIGMSGSSETDFVGSYAAIGETAGGVTTFSAPFVLQAGLADFGLIDLVYEQPGNSWGDYSATVVDPTDPHRFWTFQEYVEAEDVYAVRITELILSPEPEVLLVGGTAIVSLAALGFVRSRRANESRR